MLNIIDKQIRKVCTTTFFVSLIVYGNFWLSLKQLVENELTYDYNQVKEKVIGREREREYILFNPNKCMDANQALAWLGVPHSEAHLMSA